MTPAERALIRLLWRSIDDGASCTCRVGDQCPECEALVALGYARWVSADDAAKCLAAYPAEFRRSR